MKKRLSEHSQIIVNSMTDPAVLFNLGNVPIGFTQGWYVGLTNLSVAIISAIVRSISERKVMGKEYSPRGSVGRLLDKMASNRGFALVTSGALTLLSSSFAFVSAILKDMSYAPAGMLACFGLVHIFRGIATGMKVGFSRRALDAAGFFMAVGGYMFANPSLPVVLKIIYVLIALLAIYMALRSENPNGLIKQPDLYFAANSYVAAVFTVSPAASIGYALWATGYLSIDAMRKFGGVYQTWQYVVIYFNRSKR